MSSLMDLIQKNFSPAKPLVPFDPDRPLPAAPDKELTAAQVISRGGQAEPPAWPSPADLPSVVAARRQLQAAEENLAKLKRDIDQARAASATRPVGAEDWRKYLAGGEVRGRDKNAQASAERAAALEALLPAAKQAVDEAKAAGQAAWESCPAALWDAAAAEWKSAVVAVAASLALAVRAQLKLRSFSDRFFAHQRLHRLPEGGAVAPGLHPGGRRREETIFDALLHPVAPRANNDVVRFLEQLRAAGVLGYAPCDLRALDMTPAPHEALYRLDAVLAEIAGQLRPEPEPQPEKKGP
jgi:hypothetical protein